jgi:hypothetical protein
VQEKAAVSIEGVSEAQITELIGRALESQAALHAQPGLSIEAVRQEMAILLGDMGSQGLEKPASKYVANLASGTHGTVHVVSSATHTACGWAWATSPAADLRAESDQNDNVCVKCMCWSAASL